MNKFKLKNMHQFWSFAKPFDQKCCDAKRKHFPGWTEVGAGIHVCSMKTVIILLLDYHRNG